MNIQEKILKLKQEKMPVNIHLGCGKKILPDFLHVDRDEYPHIDYNTDISNLKDIPDESADLIYCCHALEYFDKDEVIGVLTEWNRILKHGSILRVSVPDFEKVIYIYEKTKNIELLYGFLYGKYAKVKGDLSPSIYHKITFTYQSLNKFMEQAGFKNFRLYDWRNTIHKDYDDYSQAYIPHMDKENGVLMSLNIEVDKL